MVGSVLGVGLVAERCRFDAIGRVSDSQTDAATAPQVGAGRSSTQYGDRRHHRDLSYTLFDQRHRHRGDRATVPDLAHSLVGGRLHVDAIGTQAEHAGNRFAHRRDVLEKTRYWHY